MITFNNGLGTLKTKSGGRGVGLGDVLSEDFVLRGPNASLKGDQIAMRPISHGSG